MKVVITDSNFPNDVPEREVLMQAGIVPERYSCRTIDEMKTAGRDADAVLVQFAPVTREVIDSWTKCRLIVRYGIGFDNVDVKYAESKGILVCNVPAYCLDEVADHTCALILAGTRKIVALHESVKLGHWNVEAVAAPLPKPDDTIVGLIGFGRIGERVCERLRPFRYQIAVYDPYLSEETAAAKGIRKVSDLVAFLAMVDVVSMHVPLTEETHHMINDSSLRMMKKSCIVVNTSRGALIDTKALAHAVLQGDIGGAALDVFEQEPLEHDHPLRSCPNVILTPHAAYYSDSALISLQRQAAEEVLRLVQGQPPASPLNRPVLGVQAAKERMANNV